MNHNFRQSLIPEKVALADEIKPALLIAEALKPHRNTSRKRLLFAFRQAGFVTDAQTLAIMRHYGLEDA